jgi:FlaA1/EpsC-like NDP-sugar epimerase
MSTRQDTLGAIATGRNASLFAEDIAASESQIATQLRGARVLVIGGAGSIGSSTVRQLARFDTAALHIVDMNENGLVEVVRDLRGSATSVKTADFQLLPLDFGSSMMARFIQGEAAYDFVLNFAAVKHVRSEKEICSVLHMLDTNVSKQARLLRWLHARNPSTRYFSVSTDKAANPVNLMGASKRLMEHVMFSSAVVPHSELRATSARFANVAFSDGSLLQGWLHRMDKSQPLAVPRDTRRFFVSLRESGELCLIAALMGQPRSLVVPRLDAETDLHDLQSVAEGFLRSRGFEPRLYESVQDAIANLDSDRAAGRYPLVLTPLDTSGEKPYEEFVGEGETTFELGLRHLVGVQYRPPPDVDALTRLLDTVERLVADPAMPASKAQIVASCRAVVPEFAHAETGKRLDDRF